MNLWKFGLLLVVVVHGGIDSANARTWYVELDGSGDYDDIQPAVNASAEGDTIRIGPGRFDTFHPCIAPGWTEDAIVSVTRDNLTFIGSGQGVTILGTSTYYGTPSTDPKVFCSIEPFDCTIRDMTIENVEQGIYWWGGSLIVERCIIRAFHHDFLGVFGSFDGGAAKECEFEISSVSRSVALYNTTQGFLIQNCIFRGFGFGVSAVSGSKNIVIDGCEFENSYVGVLFDGQTTGSVLNSTLQNISFEGISISSNSSVTCDRVFIDGADIGVRASGGSHITGTNSVIENTVSSGVLLFLQGMATLNTCHILPASGLSVRCIEYPGDHRILDMTDNYWGTVDPAAIAALIYDVNDDPEVHYTVNFLPIADGPVSVETKSWGDVKALFR